MVRFKPGLDLIYMVKEIKCHNSTMVRFKRRTIPIYKGIRKGSHNSTMVRFKQIWEWLEYEPVLNRSQFHYGSIQTTFPHSRQIDRIVSQFHYGSIQTKSYQFLGFIDHVVTIPLWFDSNPYRIVMMREIITSHNSTMVRFKR